MRGTGLGLCALSLGAVLAAQQQPPQTFRGGVELVVLNVTVVDKDGKPVRGLTASDFTVTLDGQARPVRALDFLELGASGGSDVTAVRQTTNERVPGAPANRGGRVIVLLIDDLSSKPGQAKGLVVAAERMLGRLDSGDLVGLTTKYSLISLVRLLGSVGWTWPSINSLSALVPMSCIAPTISLGL